MPEPGVNVDAMLAALEAESQRLTAELAAIEDEERRDEITLTLASIEEQKEHLRVQETCILTDNTIERTQKANLDRSERLRDELKGVTTEHALPPRLEDEGQSGG